jgi:hypothetical protein
VVAASSLVAIGIDVSRATATTTPTGDGPLAPSPLGLTFVPPKVGPITVVIAPTIIGGIVIDPGLQVTLPAVTVE